MAIRRPAAGLASPEAKSSGLHDGLQESAVVHGALSHLRATGTAGILNCKATKEEVETGTLTAASAPAKLVDTLAAPFANRANGLMDTCGFSMPTAVSTRPASRFAMDVNTSAMAWSARCAKTGTVIVSLLELLGTDRATSLWGQSARA